MDTTSIFPGFDGVDTALNMVILSGEATNPFASFFAGGVRGAEERSGGGALLGVDLGFEYERLGDGVMALRPNAGTICRGGVCIRLDVTTDAAGARTTRTFELLRNCCTEARLISDVLQYFLFTRVHC